MSKQSNDPLRRLNSLAPDLKNLVLSTISDIINDIQKTGITRKPALVSSIQFKHFVEKEILAKHNIAYEQSMVNIVPDKAGTGRVKHVHFFIPKDSTKDVSKTILDSLGQAFDTKKSKGKTTVKVNDKVSAELVKSSDGSFELIFNEWQPAIPGKTNYNLQRGIYKYSGRRGKESQLLAR